MRIYSFQIGTDYAAPRQPRLSRFEAEPENTVEASANRAFSPAAWRRLQQSGQRNLVLVN